jgi:hypothetical protein
MTINQICLASAALLLAGILLPIPSTVRSLLFVVLLGGGLITMIGLGLNHVGSSFN